MGLSALVQLLRFAPPALAALGWAMPGGGADQVKKALKPNVAPSVMQMSPAQQSDNAKEEAEKEAGAPTTNCPTCPPDSTSVKAPKPSFPKDPNDLLAEGWVETTHPSAAAAGHRTFKNPETGAEIRWDKGEPGERGFAADDHYHWLNPDKTRGAENLDQNGNPVRRGSDSSHIPPR